MSDDITVLGVVLGLIGGIGGRSSPRSLRRPPRCPARSRSCNSNLDGLSPAKVAGNPCAYARLDVRNDRRSGGATAVSVRIERFDGGSPEDAEKRGFLESFSACVGE
jgi:hypothetical protein